MDHTPGFLRLVETVQPRIHEISVDDARARMAAGARLLDVREDAEWAVGHAAGAEHLGKGVIERDIGTRVPDPHTELLLYCGGGFRSALAADALQRMGYTNVHSVAGGWRAWHAAGAPIVGTPPDLPAGSASAPPGASSPGASSPGASSPGASSHAGRPPA